MRDFDGFLRSFTASDQAFNAAEAMATTARERRRLAGLRQLNEQAYFVVLFAQLEQHVGDECRKLIDRKRASSDWEKRRAWEVVDRNQIPLMQKVALLTRSGGTDYNSIHAMYATRNAIAHGHSASAQTVNVRLAAIELRRLAAGVRARA